MSDRDWLTQWARPLIVAAMITAVAISWVRLFTLALPGWDGSYLVVLCFLASVEAFVSRRMLRDRLHRLDARWKYRLGELFVLYFLLQVAANLSEGRANPLANIPRFDSPTIVAFVLVVLCWLSATWSAADLDELSTPAVYYPGYEPPSERLTRRFFVGGLLVLFGAGLSRIEIYRVFDLSRASVSGLMVNVLVYFLLGTVMLGQMQYTNLTQRWRSQGASISEGLGGRWLRLSALFLGLVAVVAFLLPTSYTLGLLDTGRFLLSVLAAVLSLLLSLLMAPFLWLLSLLDLAPSGAGTEITPPRLPPVPPSDGAGGGTNLLGLLRSLLFWVVAMGILVYMLRSYVRHGGGLAAFLGGLAPVWLLLMLKAALLRRLRGYAEVVGVRLSRRSSKQSAAPQAAWKPPWSRNREPTSTREQVLYYYLDTVRRAGQEGYPRRPNQTPGEYQAALEPQLPGAREEVSGLTEAFVLARYSPHEVPSESAGRARGYWERLGRALRARREQPQGGESPAASQGSEGRPD